MAEMMRVGVITGVRQAEVREVPVPKPGAGQALVRVHACAICTWEQRTFTGVDKRTPLPFAGGHEYSGKVVEIGAGTDTIFKVGDRVAVGTAGCGECHYCRIGETTLCKKVFGRDREYEGLWGPMGMAEYKLATTDRLYRLADDLPFEEGALSEPTACVVHAQRRLNIKLGEDVLIIGGGTMGLLNMLVAKADGAQVMVSDLDPERCKKALEMGAHYAFNPKETDVPEAVKALTDGRGADVVIVAIGVGAANKQALAALGPLGRMMLFASAHPAEDLCVDPNYVHRNQIVITGSVSGDVHGFTVATKLLSARLIDVKPLIQEKMPLERIQEALELASSADRTYRIVLTM